MNIRVYESSDERSVIDLWKQVFGYSAPHNEPGFSIRKKLQVQPELLFVAMEDGTLAGTVMGGYDGHRGWIYSLAVSPRYRRRGIGVALVRHVEKALGELGCPKVNLQVLADNRQIIAFYQKLGYAVEERINLGKLL
jgi:ribosomal protein S18 acetylase RimI-like enzyme